MDNLHRLFQTTHFNIVTAAYLNVGAEWKQMVTDFRNVRIYYVREGNATIDLVNGPLELRKEHIYFIPAFSVLSGHCSDNFGHYFIHLIPDLFTDHFFKIFDFDREFPLPLPIADYLFLQIATNYTKPSMASQIAADSALRIIFSYFFRNFDNVSKLDIVRFAEVFNYIDRHISDKIYLEDLSKLMYMNKVYFSNMFKKTFGLSPQQYILQKRLDKSRSMLLDPQMSIADIAEQLHFFDSASFTNFFKKQTGMTPKEFRMKFDKKPTAYPPPQ